MSIKINPYDLIKTLIESKRLKKEEVVKYVEKIAKDARNIADAWEFIAKHIIKNKPLNPVKRKIFSQRLRAEMMIPKNGRHYAELLAFYNMTSRAIGDKVNGYWLNEIYYYIGAVLTNRQKTYTTFSEIVHEIESPLFFNEDNYGKKVNDLVDYVSILRKESGALNVLAQNMKLEKIK